MDDPHLLGYNVYEKASTDPQYSRANTELVAATQYTVSGLSSSTQYSFAVDAVYDDGYSSPMSNPAICTTG